jgi:hypothetical protein
MPQLFDTSMFNLAMQVNKPAWEGIAEARRYAVGTTERNLQAQVDKAKHMSEMIGGSMAKGMKPIGAAWGEKLGESWFPTPPAEPEQAPAVDPRDATRAMATGPYGESNEPGENLGYGPKGWRSQSYVGPWN